MPDKEKTTVYLDAGDYRKLKRLARIRNLSAAELVREAVAEYALRHEHSLLPRSVGLGRSGMRDLGLRSEDLLRGLGRD